MPLLNLVSFQISNSIRKKHLCDRQQKQPQHQIPPDVLIFFDIFMILRDHFWGGNCRYDSFRVASQHTGQFLHIPRGKVWFNRVWVDGEIARYFPWDVRWVEAGLLNFIVKNAPVFVYLSASFLSVWRKNSDFRSRRMFIATQLDGVANTIVGTLLRLF